MRLRIFICFLILFVKIGMGQVVVTLAGSGTTSDSPQLSPYTNNYDNSRNQFIITAAQIWGAGGPHGGSISTIGFRASTNGDNCNFTFNIQIKTTTTFTHANTTLTTAGGWDGGFTSFYSGTINSGSVSGWKDYAGTAFCWNGSDNIEIQICKQNSCSNPAAPYVYYHTTSSTCGQVQRYGYGSGGTGSNCSWYPSVPLYYGRSRDIPDIRFTITPSGGCPATGSLPTSTIALCMVLPISLAEFDATPTGEKVSVNWTTATEANTDYYIVERSADGISYEEVTKIKGAGNSMSLLDYSIIDPNPISGISYYRLKQVDIYGAIEYSEPVDIQFEGKEIAINNVHPNPTNSNISFDVYSPSKGPLVIEVIEYTGRVVSRNIQNIEKGTSHIDTKLDELAQGIYFIKATFEKTGNSSITRVIKK